MLISTIHSQVRQGDGTLVLYLGNRFNYWKNVSSVHIKHKTTKFQKQIYNPELVIVKMKLNENFT